MRFEGWLGGLLMLKAPDLFRIKAILSLAGEPRSVITTRPGTTPRASGINDRTPSDRSGL